MSARKVESCQGKRRMWRGRDGIGRVQYRQCPAGYCRDEINSLRGCQGEPFAIRRERTVTRVVFQIVKVAEVNLLLPCGRIEHRWSGHTHQIEQTSIKAEIATPGLGLAAKVFQHFFPVETSHNMEAVNDAFSKYKMPDRAECSIRIPAAQPRHGQNSLSFSSFIFSGRYKRRTICLRMSAMANPGVSSRTSLGPTIRSLPSRRKVLRSSPVSEVLLEKRPLPRGQRRRSCRTNWIQPGWRIHGRIGSRMRTP